MQNKIYKLTFPKALLIKVIYFFLPVKMIGLIYKITCNITGEIYIGSTTKTLRNRMAYHVADSNKCRSKQIIERQNFRYETCAEIHFAEKNDLNKSLLLQLEAIAIKGYDCINKNLPFRSEEDKKKKACDYYQEYNEKYKKTECECGGFYTTPGNKNKHDKTKKHQNFISSEDTE